MTLTQDNAAEIDLYVWEGTTDIAHRVEQALSAYDVHIVVVNGPDVVLPPRSPGRTVLAVVSVSMVGDPRFTGQDWLSTQAVPVIWVAAEVRGQDARFYPPAYAHTLPAAFTGAELRAMVGRVVRLNPDPAPGTQSPAAPFIAVSDTMQALMAEVDLFADCRSNVMVFGETGVGKERIAKRLHDAAPWRRGPFVAVNCGAVPEGLFEAHFFGHAKGAFTGAVGAHKGYFEQADGGTLFLDEIGDLPLYQQVKLLRVLESNTVTRLGSTQDIAVDFRLVAATNKNLADLVNRGVFRADLFYRLAVIELWVPNLDERGADEKKALFRSLLSSHWGADHRDDASLMPPDWLQDRVAAMSYSGNVRELSNVVERLAMIRRQLGVWDVERIDRVFSRLSGAGAANGLTLSSSMPSLNETPPLGASDRAERARILSALESNGWRRQDTAQQLGISRKALWEKMRKLQLSAGQSDVSEETLASHL